MNELEKMIENLVSHPELKTRYTLGVIFKKQNKVYDLMYDLLHGDSEDLLLDIAKEKRKIEKLVKQVNKLLEDEE